MRDRSHWIIDENGQRRWHGRRNWTEHRGRALIQHAFDTPRSVMNCLLPDQSRGWAVRILPTKEYPDGEWYRRLPDESFQAGWVEFLSDDVRFIDDTDRPPRRLAPLPRDRKRRAAQESGDGPTRDEPHRSYEGHGAAVIEFAGDRAELVVNCLFPDDSRGTAHCAFPLVNPLGGWWRRPAAGKLWQVGELLVSDGDIAFVDHEPPPTSDERGGWIDDPRLRKVWDGPNSWAEPHGQAVVVTLGDSGPFAIFACLLPDGSRATVTRALEKSGDRQHQWRRPLADGSWQTGAIEISENEVRFVDGARRTSRKLSSRSPDETPNLTVDLMASARIAELVRDRPFAEDLYRALCNTRWFRDGKEWGCTWRSAGGIVAAISARSTSISTAAARRAP